MELKTFLPGVAKLVGVCLAATAVAQIEPASAAVFTQDIFATPKGGSEVEVGQFSYDDEEPLLGLEGIFAVTDFSWLSPVTGTNFTTIFGFRTETLAFRASDQTLGTVFRPAGPPYTFTEGADFLPPFLTLTPTAPGRGTWTEKEFIGTGTFEGEFRIGQAEAVPEPGLMVGLGAIALLGLGLRDKRSAS